MTSTPARRPAGTPIGGQFAASARDETAVSLIEDPRGRDLLNALRETGHDGELSQESENVFIWTETARADSADLPDSASRYRIHVLAHIVSVSDDSEDPTDAKAEIYGVTLGGPHQPYGAAHAVGALATCRTQRHDTLTMNAALADAAHGGLAPTDFDRHDPSAGTLTFNAGLDVDHQVRVGPYRSTDEDLGCRSTLALALGKDEYLLTQEGAAVSPTVYRAPDGAEPSALNRWEAAGVLGRLDAVADRQPYEIATANRLFDSINKQKEGSR